MPVEKADVPIVELFHFCSRWFSYKPNGPGLRYEIVVSIYSEKIMWVYGPFRAAYMSDVQISPQELRRILSESEKVCAADGSAEKAWGLAIYKAKNNCFWEEYWVEMKLFMLP